MKRSGCLAFFLMAGLLHAQEFTVPTAKESSAFAVDVGETKYEKPDALPLVFSVGAECPVSEDAVREGAERAVKRVRIEPEEWPVLRSWIAVTNFLPLQLFDACVCQASICRDCLSGC